MTRQFYQLQVLYLSLCQEGVKIHILDRHTLRNAAMLLFFHLIV